MLTLKEDEMFLSTNLALEGCSTNFPFGVVSLTLAFTCKMCIIVENRVCTVLQVHKRALDYLVEYQKVSSVQFALRIRICQLHKPSPAQEAGGTCLGVKAETRGFLHQSPEGK